MVTRPREATAGSRWATSRWVTLDRNPPAPADAHLVDPGRRDVDALRPAGLGRAGQPGLLEHLPHPGGGPGGPSEVALRGVEAEHQLVGPVRPVAPGGPRMELHGGLVPQPEEGPFRVARGVAH